MLESANFTGMNLKNNSNMGQIKAMAGSTLYTDSKMGKRLYILTFHNTILEMR